MILNNHALFCAYVWISLTRGALAFNLPIVRTTELTNGSEYKKYDYVFVIEVDYEVLGKM